MSRLRLATSLPALALALVLAGLPAAAQVALPLGPDATIEVDDWGVPHISAEDPLAMADAFGYAQAGSRLFEMDVIRRIGQGRLSGLLGAGEYNADVVIRREFYDPADIDAQLDRLPAEVLALLEAYADGVNRARAEIIATGRLPALYAALADFPEEWTPHDSASVLNLFTAVTFAGEGEGQELENVAKYLELAERYGPEEGQQVWDDLYPVNDPSAPTVIQPEDEAPAPDGVAVPDRPHPGQLDLSGEAAAEAGQALHDQLAAAQQALAGVPLPRLGSYAYALDGDRTVSGSGLLLGAPQAGFTFPSTFHEVGISVPGWDCQGMTVPGLGPFVGIGWCNDHSWSLVAGNAGDQVDVYVERLVPGDPDSYLFDGQPEPFTERTETFLVKSTIDGQLDVRTETFRYSRHGAVFAVDADAGVAYTTRRAQAGEFVRTFEGLLALNTVDGGVPEILANLGKITATYNATFADRFGNIGYAFTGLQPIRAEGYDRRFAMPGTGEAEWQGFIPADEMPQVLNPANGVIAVNQGVESKSVSWWPASSWLSIGRVNRVEANYDLFTARDDWDLDGMVAANRESIETVEPMIGYFADYVDEALADLEPGDPLESARDAWEAWKAAGFVRVDSDGDGRFDHPGLTVFTPDRYYGLPASPLWSELVGLVFDDALPGGFNWGHYFSRLSLLKHVLDGPDADRELANDYLARDDRPREEVRAELLREAVKRALPALEQRYGTADIDEWRIEITTLRYTAMSLAAPRSMHTVDHGTYSLVVDHGTGEGVSILPPGNGSADTVEAEARFELTGELPEFANDQIDLYERWAFKPMRPVGPPPTG